MCIPQLLVGWHQGDWKLIKWKLLPPSPSAFLRSIKSDSAEFQLRDLQVSMQHSSNFPDKNYLKYLFKKINSQPYPTPNLKFLGGGLEAVFKINTPQVFTINRTIWEILIVQISCFYTGRFSASDWEIVVGGWRVDLTCLKGLRREA